MAKGLDFSQERNGLEFCSGCTPGEEATSKEIHKQHLEQLSSTQLVQEVRATVDDTPIF